jgi:GTP-binding protein EngB required for normal cell division
MMADAEELPGTTLNGTQHDGSSQTRRAEDALRAYLQTKQELAARVRTALGLLRVRGTKGRIERCQELLVKLAEDRFNLVVLGQFKRGKSSLMNAVIGRELLPTGLLPLTSVVTMLRFGPTERLLLARDESWVEEAPISRLAEYVTERGNPGNVRKIRAAYIDLPLSLLRRGLHFVDTPGIGSSREENTATTYAFLPECDAALLVTSVETPLTELELDFLRTIREHARKVFYVVNKTDLLSAGEREEVLGFIRDGLREVTGSEEVRLFPVSAREALKAKLTGDQERLARSGITNLEHALATFLATEKSHVLLLAVLDRVLRLVDEELAETRAQAKVASTPEETQREHRARIAAKLDDLERREQETVAELRSQLVEWAQTTAQSDISDFLAQTREGLVADYAPVLEALTCSSAGRSLQRVFGEVQERLFQELGEWLRARAGDVKSQLQSVEARLRPRFEQALSDVLQAALGEPKVTAAQETVSVIVDSVPDIPTPDWQRPSSGVSAWLYMMPARFVRSSFRRRLSAALDQTADVVHEMAMDAVLRAVDVGVDVAAKQYERHVADFRERIAALAGPRSSGRKTADGSPALSAADLGQLESSLEGVRTELLALRDGVLVAGSRPVPPSDAPAMGREEIASAVAVAQEAATRATATSLLDDLATRGCPICDRIAHAAFDFYAKWQYAISRDGEARRAHTATRGLCPLHTWQFASVASPQGIDTGYFVLLQQMERELASLTALPPEQLADKVKEMIPDSDDCLACRVLRDIEATSVTRLARFIETADGREAYRRSQGVCMRHLVLLLAAGPSGETAGFLVSEQARHFGQTAEDMQSYTLKFDAVRRALMNVDERDAHTRALVHLVGAESVVAPWSERE